MPWKFEDPSGKLVENLRAAVVFAYEQDNGIFDPHDYHCVLREDWFLQRFLMELAMKEEEAKEMLIKALKWRKSNSVRYIKASHFPVDFHRMGALFPYAEDKRGCPSLYLRIKFVQRIPEFQETLKRFLVYHIQSIDERTEGSGYVLVLDFHGASFRNCDLDLVKFLINTIRLYFPVGVNCILINELPKLLNAFWRLIRPFIPRNANDLIRFTSYESMRELFEDHHLPDFANGTCKIDYRAAPDGCPTTENYGLNQLGLKAEDMKRILNKYKSVLGVK